MIKKHQSTQIAYLLRGLVAKLAAVPLIVLTLAGSTRAGSSVFLTPVADLGELPFSSDSGLSSPPAINDWVSYILGVSTDDGSKIQAVDVNLKGPFGQSWSWDADARSFASTPSSLSVTGGDSHLMLPTNALTPISPIEDSSLLSSSGPPPGNSGSLSYGVGSTMHGAWAVPGIENATSSMNLAYLVIPRGSESQLEYAIDGADSGGNILFQFRQGASFPPPPPPAPLPSPLPPIVAQPPVVNPVLPEQPTLPHQEQPLPPSSIGDPIGGVWHVDPYPPGAPEPPQPQPPLDQPAPTPPASPPLARVPRLITEITRVPFAAGVSAAQSAGLAAYQLDAQTDDGSLIAALDVTINGPLHQQWANADGELNLTSTPRGRAADGGVDSHLTIPTDALTINAIEDNGAALNPAPDATEISGTGSLLSGVWGMIGSEQTDKAQIAYLVLPDNIDPASLDIQVLAAMPNGEKIQPLYLAQVTGIAFSEELSADRVDYMMTNTLHPYGALNVGTLDMEMHSAVGGGAPGVPEPTSVLLTAVGAIGVIGLVVGRPR